MATTLQCDIVSAEAQIYSGAVELLACILALRDGIIAPTIGYEEQDPECALDIVPNEAREAKVELAISNAFAFGGLNAVLVLQKV